MNLHQLSIEQQARILSIHLPDHEVRRLFYLGVYPGAYIKKLCIAPLHDPVVYKVMGKQLVLRNQEARCIEVEVIV